MFHVDCLPNQVDIGTQLYDSLVDTGHLVHREKMDIGRGLHICDQDMPCYQGNLNLSSIPLYQLEKLKIMKNELTYIKTLFILLG